MTDIPGTITTAIRGAIDAAVLAERGRCVRAAQIVAAGISEDEGINVEIAAEIIAAIGSAPPESDPIKLGIPWPRHLTTDECNLLTQEFGVGWILEGFPQRDAVVARIERMVKESIGCSDPEPEGQHFDITAGTFVSNKSDDRAGWAKRFANMAARTFEEDQKRG